MYYGMRKANELAGQCAVRKFSKHGRSMEEHGPLDSWRILSTVAISDHDLFTQDTYAHKLLLYSRGNLEGAPENYVTIYYSHLL